MVVMRIDRTELAESLAELAEKAGREILGVYHQDFEVRDKRDASPVTDADERAERVILDDLRGLAPDLPVVAEESVSAGVVPDVTGGVFFLVDPLDGTKEFISRNGEFTVNIALVESGAPTVGTVHLPALGESYWTDGQRAWRRRNRGAPEPIRCRRPAASLVVVASRSHRDAKTDKFLEDYEVGELISAGSSLKLCRVAEGAADMYPRLGRTMEWDIAAGHAVLRAAGGSVQTLDGAPLSYGKPGFDNPHFIARGLSA